MFATIDLGVGAPSFLHIAAGLLDGVGGIEPMLEMASAKLAFLVFLVAGTLSRFLDLDFVVGELRDLRTCGNSCRQRCHPRSSGHAADSAVQLHSTRRVLRDARVRSEEPRGGWRQGRKRETQTETLRPSFVSGTAPVLLASPSMLWDRDRVHLS